MGANKANLKIAAATSMTIFSLLACFMGAYAWFNNTRTNSKQSDDFSVSVISHTVSSIEFYPFAGFDAGATYYKFSNTPMGTVSISDGVATYSGSFKLGAGIDPAEMYDTDDPHHPVLMLLNVSEALETTITFETESTYITLAGQPYAKDDPDHTNPLSSVVQFHAIPFAKTGAGSKESRQQTYSDCISIATSELTSSNFSSFVQIENGEYVGFNDSIIAYSGFVGESEYVGIVIDYYAASLEYIYSFFMGNEVISDGITFACDWETVL